MCLPPSARLRIRMLLAVLLLLLPTWYLVALAPSPDQRLAEDLLPGVRLEAAGKPIDAEKIGHAAPFVGDFFGDGKQDLLVGQFSGGILKIYRNNGTNAKPKLAAGETFKVGKEDGRVPTG